MRVWFPVKYVEGGTGNVNCLCLYFVPQTCSMHVAVHICLSPCIHPFILQTFPCFKDYSHRSPFCFPDWAFSDDWALRFSPLFWTVPATGRTTGQSSCVHLATGNSCLFLLQTHQCFLIHTEIELCSLCWFEPGTNLSTDSCKPPFMDCTRC